MAMARTAVMLCLALAALAACAHGQAARNAPRYWPRFAGNREVWTLDGDDWAYALNLDSSFDSMDPNFNPGDAETPNTTSVPSCMDVVAGGAAGYLGPRGVAMYRKSMGVLSAQPHRLQFQSCSFYCRVWVNGHLIGDHRAGGYVTFSLDVPASALNTDATPNELFVLADNRFNKTTAPLHTGGDFWEYGGLTRSVELHVLQAAAPSLWRAYVLPSGADATQPGPVADPGAVDLTLHFSAPVSGPTVDFQMGFDGAAPTAASAPVTANGTTASINLVKVPNPTLWSTAEPNLHTVTIVFNGGSVTERFGLRAFGVDKATSRVTINGKIQKLVGWNHHTQWPVTAASPTDWQMDQDIALLKEGGATYVRGAHYPQDPRWLDRLDEAGIVMWSETLGPGVSVKNTQDWDGFMHYQLIQLREMMDAAFNHASIYTWAWFNEGPSSSEDACPAYQANNDEARTRDKSRFTTWASDKDLSDRCLEHATLVSFNHYPAWYDHGDPTEWNKFANGVRAGQTASGATTMNKPLVISETGAGGIFEWDANATDAKWTLKYQSEVIAGDVDVALSNGNISGITLWHFFDFKVDNGGGQEDNTHCQYDHPPPETFAQLNATGPPNCTYIKINNRPGGENHKGVLDFWRRPKPSFYETAAKYNASTAAGL